MSNFSGEHAEKASPTVLALSHKWNSRGQETDRIGSSTKEAWTTDRSR
jgi:hypothetical protein